MPRASGIIPHRSWILFAPSWLKPAIKVATARFIVNGALRKLGRLGAGREARLSDAEDTLDALRGLYQAWIASGAFGRLADVIPQTDYTASENQRVFRNSENAVQITLPEVVPMYANPRPYNRERATYTNYEQVDGNNRPPRDGAVVQIVDAFTGEMATFIYDGTLKRWAQIEAMSLDDEAPRSVTDPEGLRAVLAMEVADQFGAEITPTIQRQAARYTVAMTSSFSMPRETVQGVYC
jgi:hypothetical protein